MATDFEKLMDEASKCGRAQARLHVLISAARDVVNLSAEYELPPGMQALVRFLDSEARSANATLVRDCPELIVADYAPAADPLRPRLPECLLVLAGGAP